MTKTEFPDHEHIPFDSLHEVVESVARRKCDLAVVPFYNTTRKSIEESQLELIAHRGKVFVSDVLPLQVRHFLCGFGKLNEITELRSKSVVFHQISKWLIGSVPKAKLVDYPSTSAAIMSLRDDGQPGHAAAIGTRSATKKYRVPVLRSDVQNKPNVTLFFVLQPTAPKPEDMDHVLLCSPNATIAHKTKLEDTAGKNGCAITSNWPLVTGAKKQSEAYFAEINGQYSTLGLHTAIIAIRAEFPKTFIVGGYKGKCITRLLWDGATRK